MMVQRFMKNKKALLLLEPGTQFSFFRPEYVGEIFEKTPLRKKRFMCCIRLIDGRGYWFNSVKKVVPIHSLIPIS